MELSNERQFPFSMETAWAALHKPAMLDVEPGAEVHEVSAERWEARNKEAGTVTVYTASYDEEGKTLTIEGESTAKSDHDFLYLTLKEDGAKSVTLEIKIEIHTGAHLIARALGAVFAKPCRRSCAGTFITTLRRCARGKKRSGCRRPNWTVLRKRFLKRSNPKKDRKALERRPSGLLQFYSLRIFFFHFRRHKCVSRPSSRS